MFIKVNGMVYSTEGIKNFGSHSVAGKEELVLTFRNGNSVEVREMDKVRRDFPKCSFFTAMAAIQKENFIVLTKIIGSQKWKASSRQLLKRLKR